MQRWDISFAIHVGKEELELSLNVIIPPNSSLSQNRLMSQECKISDNKSGKLSQNTPVLPQVITIQEIS